jgi:hypothetical protein
VAQATNRREDRGDALDRDKLWPVGKVGRSACILQPSSEDALRQRCVLNLKTTIHYT